VRAKLRASRRLIRADHSRSQQMPLEVSACSAGWPAGLGLFDDLCYHDEIAGLKRNCLSGR